MSEPDPESDHHLEGLEQLTTGRITTLLDPTPTLEDT